MDRKTNLTSAIGMDDPDAFKREVQGHMNDLAQDLKEIQEAQANGKTVEDYKFLGFIPMPAMAGAAVRSLMNPLLGKLGGYAQSHAGEIVGQHVIPRLGITNLKHQNIAVNGAALLVGASVTLADDATKLWNGFSTYKKEVGKAFEKIAPVLDDIKGGHGFAAALTVSRDQNEVIYAHRRRLGLFLSMNSANAFIGAGSKAPYLFNLMKPMLGLHSKEGAKKEGSQDFNLLDLAGGGLGTVSEVYQDSLRNELKRANATPSALMMITDLADQVKNNPDATDFVVMGSRREASLSTYIAYIFKEHQKDMMRYDPDCAEIRKSLNEDLIQASEKIADAIQQNKIDPLMLVRLVGECQVVKNNGRSIAKLHDVEVAIRKLSSKAHSYVHVDKQEFFSDINKKDIVAALGKMEGEERQFFVASLPRNIAQELGVSDAEYTAAEEAVAPTREKLIAHRVVGLADTGEKELERRGYNAEEIGRLEQVSQDILSKGTAAVGQYVTSATQADGVERLVQRAVIDGALKGEGHTVRELGRRGAAMVKKAALEAKSEEEEMSGFSGKVRRSRDDVDVAERY